MAVEHSTQEHTGNPEHIGNCPQERKGTCLNKLLLPRHVTRPDKLSVQYPS